METMEEPKLSDNPQVSSDPVCELTSKAKISTEDFLRHESNINSFKPVESCNDEVNVPKIPMDIESKDHVTNPGPPSNRLHAMESVSGDSHNENNSVINNSNSDVCKIASPLNEKSDDNKSDKVITVSDKVSSETSDLPTTPDTNGYDILSPNIGDLPEEKSDVSSTHPIGNSYEVNGETPSTTISNESTKDKTTEEPKEEWMDILGSGHLLKKVIKAGEPDTRPNKSDICVLSIIGRLEDGTVVEKLENIKIHLNDNEVIQGIDFALALMDKGEEAELKVGPRFAYGSLGRKPDIPAGATLFYSVKLHDVQEDPPISTLPVNERIVLGLQKKVRGNWWYSREEHSIAINCYRRALEFLDDTDIPEPHDEDGVRKLIEERLKTYNNLTASQMKIHAYDAALMSVNYVLTSQPQNVKALFRKSKILKEKGDIPEAIKVVRLALSHDPESQSLQQELSSLLAAQRKHNTEQRELYKKMMGTNSNQGKSDENKNSKNTHSVIKWTTVFAFAIAVVAGTVALKYKM